MEQLKIEINPNAWYDNQDILHILNISKRQAQHYRDSGILSFSQVGAKVYYKGENILKMLESNLRKGKY